MYQQDEQKQFPWTCVTCLEQSDFFLKKCQYCGTLKEQFCQSMKIDYNSNFNEDFNQLIIIDFDCNRAEDRQEILELLICKILLTDSDHKVINSKQFIVKPFLIPLIQNPDYCSIKQAQADNGVKFEETFQYLDGEVFIFESQAKAKIFLDQCHYLKLECPIKKYIELKRVFPNSNGSLNTNSMLKTLKIPYDSDCFALAEIVAELLNRSQKFKRDMLQTLAFPIPEEENRLIGFDNIIVLDFEATCVQDNNKKFNQEIIEFPAQVYNLKAQKVTKVYHKYIKPTENPILTDFCTELTGITQEKVDNGILLEQAVLEFQEFISNLGKSCILTCGDYDLHLLKKEAQRKNIQINKQLKYYINIKKVFPKNLRDKNNLKDPCMVEMLELCKLDLLGRHHSGIDDVKNITRVVDFLIRQENFKFDERMILYTFKI